MMCRVVLLFVLFTQLSACAVVTVADAAVSVAATSIKVVAKATGAVVGAAIPDGDDEDDG